jgi:hypothetical protein
VLASPGDSYVHLRSLVYFDGEELIPAGSFVTIEGLEYGELYYLGADGQPTLEETSVELGVVVDIDILYFWPVIR